MKFSPFVYMIYYSIYKILRQSTSSITGIKSYNQIIFCYLVRIFEHKIDTTQPEIYNNNISAYTPVLSGNRL